MRNARRQVARRLERAAQARELKRLRSLPPDGPTSTTLLGQRVAVSHPHVFASQFDTIFMREQYRFAWEHPEPRILDCGANLGLASIYWKRLFPGARITAFEADPAIAETARATLAACDIRDVEVVAAAVAAYDGDAYFNVAGDDTGHVTRESTDAVKVPAIRLRSLLDQPVALLKLDIEGSETDVVLDCADRLSQVTHLFVEYHAYMDRPQRLDELLAVLREAGLRYHLVPEIVAEVPFVARPEYAGMDMAVNVFAFRAAP